MHEYELHEREDGGFEVRHPTRGTVFRFAAIDRRLAKLTVKNLNASVPDAAARAAAAAAR